MEFNDQNIIIMRRRTAAKFPLVIVDPEKDVPLQIKKVTYSFVDAFDREVWGGEFGPDGDHDSGIDKDPTKPNLFWFSMDLRKAFGGIEYLSFFESELQGADSEILRNYKLIKCLDNVYYRLMPVLRGQIDKARKTAQRLDIDGKDYNFDGLDWDYKDYQLATYLDLGVQMINLISPQTYFSVSNFPHQYFGSLLILASMISALDAQKLFSIDTDFDYSLGGNAIRVDHFTNLNTFNRDIVERFNASVKVFKQRYRTKGTAIIQVQYGIGLGRFLNVVPSGWWSRFGIAVTPPSIPTRFSNWS